MIFYQRNSKNPFRFATNQTRQKFPNQQISSQIHTHF